MTLTNAPGRYWIIRHPSSQGAIVAKFDTQGETRVPQEIVDSDDFRIQQVADRSALVDKSVDHSGLTDDELALLRQVYPTE